MRDTCSYNRAFIRHSLILVSSEEPSMMYWVEWVYILAIFGIMGIES